MYLEGSGIPYMGGKRKLSSKIIDFIITKNPNTEYFYDLFGGGGAITFTALQHYKIKKVFYNELNEGIFNLIKDIRDNGVRPEYFEWVDRETFHKYKDLTCWKAGLIKTCWSFGGNQKSYLFSEKNESLKRPLHEIVVNKCNKSIMKNYLTSC